MTVVWYSIVASPHTLDAETTLGPRSIAASPHTLDAETMLGPRSIAASSRTLDAEMTLGPRSIAEMTFPSALRGGELTLDARRG